jgi:hypothetical protein
VSHTLAAKNLRKSILSRKEEEEGVQATVCKAVEQQCSVNDAEEKIMRDLLSLIRRA